MTSFTEVTEYSGMQMYWTPRENENGLKIWEVWENGGNHCG